MCDLPRLNKTANEVTRATSYNELLFAGPDSTLFFELLDLILIIGLALQSRKRSDLVRGTGICNRRRNSGAGVGCSSYQDVMHLADSKSLDRERPALT